MIVAFSRISLAVLLTVCLANVVVSQTGDFAKPGEIYLKVTQDREIVGAPIAFNEINVATSFGDVTIPLAKIEGIKLHADEQDNAVIAFKNGDLVTGKISLDVIQVKTQWGTAHVKTPKINMLTMTPNAVFYADAKAGGWRFKKASPISVPDAKETLILPTAGRTNR